MPMPSANPEPDSKSVMGPERNAQVGKSEPENDIIATAQPTSHMPTAKPADALPQLEMSHILDNGQESQQNIAMLSSFVQPRISAMLNVTHLASMVFPVIQQEPDAWMETVNMLGENEVMYCVDRGGMSRSLA